MLRKLSESADQSKQSLNAELSLKKKQLRYQIIMQSSKLTIAYQRGESITKSVREKSEATIIENDSVEQQVQGTSDRMSEIR